LDISFQCPPRDRSNRLCQRTQLVNALRGHLAEHGIVAARGLAKVKVLATAMQDTGSLHPLMRELGRRYLDHIARLDAEIAELDKRLRQLSKDDETAKRLQTMPGMGPITAAAIEAFAPPMATFKRGRDFAAWLGLVPRQHTTGGKPRLGRTSKMAQRDIRRLLIIGAMTVVRWAVRKGAAKGVVADPNAGRETALGGGHRPGQQDGPFGLGDAQQGRRISRISAGVGLIGRRLRWSSAMREVAER